MTSLLAGIGFLRVGTAVNQPCDLEIGAAKFILNTDSEKMRINSFNWYFFPFPFTELVSLSLIIYIQFYMAWTLCLEISAAVMLLSRILYFMEKNKYYVKVKATGGSSCVWEFPNASLLYIMNFNFKHRRKREIVEIAVVTTNCMFGYKQIKQIYDPSKPFLNRNYQNHILLYGYILHYFPALLSAFGYASVGAIVTNFLWLQVKFFLFGNTCSFHCADALFNCHILPTSWTLIKVVSVGNSGIEGILTVLVPHFVLHHAETEQSTCVTFVIPIGAPDFPILRTNIIIVVLGARDVFGLECIIDYARLLLHVQNFRFSYIPHGLVFQVQWGAWNPTSSLIMGSPREHQISHMFTNTGSYLIPLVEYKTWFPSLLEIFFTTIPNMLHLKTVTQWLEFLFIDMSNVYVNNVVMCHSWAYASSKLLSQSQVVRKIGYLIEFECSNVAAAEFQDLHTSKDMTLSMMGELARMLNFSIRILTRQPQLLASTKARSSQFKQWDPGKFGFTSISFNLEDKVAVKENGMLRPKGKG